MAKHFTRQEIEEIRMQLAQQGRKDTDFIETDKFTGDDYFVIVQDGQNKKISADTFRSDYNEIAEQDHQTAMADHQTAESDSAQAGRDHQTAANDHAIAVADHDLVAPDHAQAEADSLRARQDHNIAVADHAIAVDDHNQAASDSIESAEATTNAITAAALANAKAELVQDKLDVADQDHVRAESDHRTAATDHTIADGDHTAALLDHENHVLDHAQSAEDSRIAGINALQARNDHTRAESDHSTALNDHTTAQTDHGIAVADHNVATDAASLANEKASEAENAAVRANTAAAAAEHQVDVKRGYGIQSVTQPVVATTNGGVNTIRVTTEDGKTFDFQVRNGKSSAGFFQTSQALNTAIPSPNVGDYAFVSKVEDGSFPAYIYVCTTAGTWSATDVEYDGDNVDLTPYATKEQVSQLGQEVDLLNNLLDVGSVPAIPMSLGYIVCNGGVGTVVNLTPVSHTKYKYGVESCSSGDVFYIMGKGGTADRLFCFIDSENKIISYSARDIVWDTWRKVIAPSRSAKVIINDETGEAVSYHGQLDIYQRLVQVEDDMANIPITARCVDIQYTNNGVVTMDVIYLYRYKQLYKTIYCDGDASSHSPKSYRLGSTYFVLALDSNYNVVLRLNNSDLRNGDIVLLTYNSSSGFDGGELLPSLLALRGDANALIVQARCLDLVVNSQNSVTIDEVYLYSKSGVITAYADGVSVSHSPKTFTFGYSNNFLLVLDSEERIVQRSNNRYLLDGDIVLLSYSNSVGFDGGLLYGEYLRVKLSETPSVDADNSQVYQSAKKIADSYGNGLTPLSIACDEIGYELPTTRQERDVQKKIEQLTGIKWTPLFATPNADGSGTYSANVEKTGLPYSSVKERDKFVGFEVSLHTFMTAVNNPYSLLYTENVSEAHSASAWGKTYHGVNCGTYYGVVCNVFATQCCGFDVIWNTQQHNWQSNYLFNLIRVFNQSAQGLKIGDIVWRSGHDQIVYAIKRNSDGDVVGVVLAESMGMAHINSEISSAEFDNLLATHIVYRGLELFKNKYTPSPFVAIRDEVIAPYVYNDDICCFAGDKACFREGETIAINYNLKQVGAWNAIELYKNDTLLETISIDTSSHIFDLTSRNLSYGKYKARLTDGTSFSDYTEFEILQTTVSKEAQGERTKISFSSSNGTPIYFRVCDIRGNNKGTHEFTEKELNDGYCLINLDKLNSEQYPSSPFSGNTYIKVFFRGEFGQVTNEPLQFI